MRALRYKIEPGSVMGAMSSAIVPQGELPTDMLAEDAINAISTDVRITAGGVTLPLCCWQDPGHWADDWREAIGDQDPYEFINGLIEERA